MGAALVQHDLPLLYPGGRSTQGVNSWELCFDYATAQACGDFPTGGVRTFPDAKITRGKAQLAALLQGGSCASELLCSYQDRTVRVLPQPRTGDGERY